VKADLPLALTTRLVDTETTPMLLKLLAAKKLPAEKMITHRMLPSQSDAKHPLNSVLLGFKFGNVMDAYKTFDEAAENRALKVIIEMQ
jgi:alcohol dehydrogenase